MLQRRINISNKLKETMKCSLLSNKLRKCNCKLYHKQVFKKFKQKLINYHHHKTSCNNQMFAKKNPNW